MGSELSNSDQEIKSCEKAESFICCKVMVGLVVFVYTLKYSKFTCLQDGCISNVGWSHTLQAA